MSKDFFCFSKHNPIVIYGGNKNGINYYRRLLADGYIINGFVDRKAKQCNHLISIDEKEISVYEPEEIDKLDKDVIIVIAIRNVIEQNNVASFLWKRSFMNVVYFPMVKKNMHNVEYLSRLKNFYQEFINEKICENAVLPTQKILQETGTFWDQAFISKNDEYVKAWMPLSIIHYYAKSQSQKMVDECGITTSNGVGEKYLDRSIFQLDWLNELFRFFLNGQNDLKNYWELEKRISNYVKQQSTKENQMWFRDRQKCAEMLMSEINGGGDFFIHSAVPVQWNKKGYFNICDGGHRCAFWNCMNLSMVPVQISLEDYRKWMNKKALERLLNYMKLNKITTFETPIPHPWFYGCEVQEEKFGNTILKSVLEQMMQLKVYSGFSVLDLNPKDGYYLQHFVRIGANNVTGIVYNDEHYDFLIYLNQLLYMDKVIRLATMETEIETNNNYDIVLIMKKLCTLGNEERINYIKWIASKTKMMIIWESGVEYEEEKRLILKYSGFRKYVFLKRVLSGNVIREVGIFLKI